MVTLTLLKTLTFTHDDRVVIKKVMFHEETKKFYVKIITKRNSDKGDINFSKLFTLETYLMIDSSIIDEELDKLLEENNFKPMNVDLNVQLNKEYYARN